MTNNGGVIRSLLLPLTSIVIVIITVIVIVIVGVIIKVGCINDFNKSSGSDEFKLHTPIIAEKTYNKDFLDPENANYSDLVNKIRNGVSDLLFVLTNNR